MSFFLSTFFELFFVWDGGNQVHINVGLFLKKCLNEHWNVGDRDLFTNTPRNSLRKRFCGGNDIKIWRWDSPQERPTERKDWSVLATTSVLMRRKYIRIMYSRKAFSATPKTVSLLPSSPHLELGSISEFRVNYDRLSPWVPTDQYRRWRENKRHLLHSYSPLNELIAHPEPAVCICDRRMSTRFNGEKLRLQRMRRCCIDMCQRCIQHKNGERKKCHTVYDSTAIQVGYR